MSTSSARATQKRSLQAAGLPQNVQLDTLIIDDHYEDKAQAHLNANLWANAKKLAAVRDKFEQVSR